MIKPIAKFPVRPGVGHPFPVDRRFYYHVQVFATKQDMWTAGYRLSGCEENRDGYGAITMPMWRERYNQQGDRWISPKIGNVLFYRDALGAEIISHESVHMATHFLRLTDELKLSDRIDDDEEKLAYCIGGCAKQIVQWLYKLEIL